MIAKHLVDVSALAIQNPFGQGEFTPQAVCGSTMLPTMNDMGPRSRTASPVQVAAGAISIVLIGSVPRIPPMPPRDPSLIDPGSPYEPPTQS